MIGFKVGKLTIIKDAGKNIKDQQLWECSCSCGNIVIIKQYSLTNKCRPTQSCGCLQKQTLSNLRKGDITNKQFGHLIALRSSNIKDYRGTYFWECLCDCGNIVNIRIDALSSRNNTSCGCRKIAVDLTNKKLGRLIVIYKLENKKWHCKCDCGNYCDIETGSLVSGATQSCGCIRKEQIINRNKAYRVSLGLDPNKKIRRFSAERSIFRKYTAAIRDRDNHKCVWCGEDETNETLHVHHIIPLSANKELRFISSNLISLCSRCHLEYAHNNNYSRPLNKNVQSILESFMLLSN